MSTPELVDDAKMCRGLSRFTWSGVIAPSLSGRSLTLLYTLRSCAGLGGGFATDVRMFKKNFETWVDTSGGGR